VPDGAISTDAPFCSGDVNGQQLHATVTDSKAVSPVRQNYRTRYPLQPKSIYGHG
jgi:hypothetical protein